jgi:serine phosphatase RsbU (regulator of sigma subunit)
MLFKNNFFFLSLLIIFSGPGICFSQSAKQGHLVMDGLVYGYNYDSSKKLLKKEKQLKVEGVLDHVTVEILENKNVIKTTQTNSNGLFLLKIKTGKTYTLQLSKPGYSPILLVIDLTGVPAEIANKGLLFSGAELILNSFQSKNTPQENLPFGKLFYNIEKKYLDFEEAKFLSKRQRGSIDNPVSLMKRSVQKNKNNISLNSTPSAEASPAPSASKKEVKSDTSSKMISLEPEKKAYYDPINKALSEFKLKTNDQLENISESDIEDIENKVKEARIQFENDKLNASSEEDLDILNEREAILNFIELELAEAKRLIELQKTQITTQRQLLLLTLVCIILLSVLLLAIYRFNKQKKKTYLLLKEKNKKITDSINYASRIQESILPADAEIKKLLPESFIYYQPRDVVSGDFYWLSTVKEKTIIACVDCTGHGVPGAFMSLIGNTLLNEIINEKQIVDPATILKRLHLEVIKALHQDSDRTQSKDGMEMSLCVIDVKAKQIEFAGAMNPLFIVKNNTTTVIKPDIKGIGGDTYQNQEAEFSNQIIPIEKNMSVYMFTDGYMDQFGGPTNKKFNISNFKKLLLEIQSQSMEQQKRSVEQTIKDWQGNGKQIDDMLVIGIKF